MRGSIEKVCECCGRSFECGQYGCWCGTIGITERQMDWIEQSFSDCLCPDCLTKVVNGEAGPASGPAI